MKNPDELRKFGQKITEMRTNAHMTQMQLEDALNISYGMISKYETGASQMGALLYDKILDVLGQKPDNPKIANLIQLFTSLTPENQQLVIDLASALRKR